jgi:hypothetical protein
MSVMAVVTALHFEPSSLLAALIVKRRSICTVALQLSGEWVGGWVGW